MLQKSAWNLEYRKRKMTTYDENATKRNCIDSDVSDSDEDRLQVTYLTMNNFTS